MNHHTEETWDDLREGYLREVRRALSRSGHPRAAAVLDDLRDHLGQRFAEMPPDERTSDRLREIIDEMGTPEEYAEILTDERGAPRLFRRLWQRRALRRCVLWLFSLGLVAYCALQPWIGLIAVWVLAYIALVVAIGFRFTRTRDAGFLWLGLAVIVYPLLTLAGQHHLQKLIEGAKTGMWPFTLVESGRMTLGALSTALAYSYAIVWHALLFVAVLTIARPSRHAVAHRDA